ncbi:hypothetical protein GGX14DRAFT_525723 [Mycena pura]|uniref:SET domain-containing protein n=1 Tax=Mycena pura TaxID=153505 RepID=A0AAD6V1Y7_9AGAR|nr:hypothetical protein GGX14DRAFT_525723 [Mycena pura]
MVEEVAHPENNFQFSVFSYIFSKQPYIVTADHRLVTSWHFLFLPSEHPNIVFVDSLEGVQATSKWGLWNEPCPPPPPHPPFVIRDCGEKGMGMFARRSIARGELIILERPIYVTQPNVSVHPDQQRTFYEASLAGLSSATQASFMSLRNARPETQSESPIFGRILTNALAVKVPHSKVRFPGLFPQLCRANHDCAPNAHYFFCAETFTGHFYAVRAIAAGEEITMGYIDPMASREQRQSLLSAKYKFRCTCMTCELPPARVLLSDARRQAIAEYFLGMKDTGSKFPKDATLPHVKDLVRWAEEEGLVEGASILIMSGLRLAQRDGNHSEMLKFTADAVNYIRAMEGNDSAGFAMVASRLGFSAQQLASIFDDGLPIDYTLFERMLAKKQV